MEPRVTLAEKLAVFTARLEERKAVEPVCIDLAAEHAFTDALIVAGATSRRQAQGLADAITDACRENSYEFNGMEGYELADWILVDCGDIVINIFLEETRGLYRLEELWLKNGRHAPKEALP